MIKKIIAIILSVVVSVLSFGEGNFNAYIEKSDPLYESCMGIFEDYFKYYDVNKFEITKIFDDDKETIYQVDLYVTVKFSDPKESDYFKGVCAAINEIEQSQKDTFKSNIDNAKYIYNERNQIYDSLKSYVDSEQHLPFMIKMLKENDKTKPMILCGVEYTVLDKIEIQSPSELFEMGYNNIVTSYKESAKSRANYSASSAVSYCTQYTSNPSSCNLHSSCGFKTDTTKYNSTYSNYASSHSDCCNFASQALYAGGLPTDSTWQPYTSAWTSVTSLTSYMNSNHYWVPTKVSDLRTGNFAVYNYTSGGKHIVMITSFDGITPKASGHTNDCLNGYVPTSNSTSYTMKFYRVTY